MATRTPYAARTRYVRGTGPEQVTVQTFTRLNPTIPATDMSAWRDMMAVVRDAASPVERGYYTLQDRLTR